MTTVVDVLVAGEAPMPQGYVFRPPGGNAVTRLARALRGGGKPLVAPLLAFVVRHPSAGPILIDTGLHPDASTDLRGDFGLAMGLMFRKLEPAAVGFADQLRALGLEPGELETVVMTHLHVDHTGGMRLLGRAQFACSREEWAAATGRSASRNGYVAKHLPPQSRMRLLDFERDGEPHGPFARTIDLLGDGSIRLLSTPGHTPGHLSVLLRLADGRDALLIGDAVYTMRSLREERLPLLTNDDEAYLRSMREIRAYAEREPGAVLVPTHDADAWRSLRPADDHVALVTGR